MQLVKHNIDISTAAPPEAPAQRYTPEPQVERKFRDALAYLVFKWQLFAQLIYSDMHLVYTHDVPIAATDSKRISSRSSSCWRTRCHTGSSTIW
jgi:hypothetical protein